MENLISFCRTLCDGKIMFAKGYGRFGTVPLTDLEIIPMVKESIDDFLKKMDSTLYYLNEVTYLYFFYKINKTLYAVRYSNYGGGTEISNITIEDNTLTADDVGKINVFIPGSFSPVN